MRTARTTLTNACVNSFTSAPRSLDGGRCDLSLLRSTELSAFCASLFDLAVRAQTLEAKLLGKRFVDVVQNAVLLQEASSRTLNFHGEALWTPLDPTGTPRSKSTPVLYGTLISTSSHSLDPTGPHDGPHVFLKEASHEMRLFTHRAYSYYNTK